MGGHQPGEIVDRTMQREHLAKTGSRDRQVPALTRLRAEKRQAPALERRAPAFDGRLDSFGELASERGVNQLRAANRYGHFR